MKKIPKWLVADGRVMNRKCWADELKVDTNTIRYWLRKGMKFKDIYKKFKGK